MRGIDKFIEQFADIIIKIFQIVFAMLVVGMLLQKNFDVRLFWTGVGTSVLCLTLALLLYYNAYIMNKERGE